MTGFVMFIHALVALLLMVVILMQSGRGGGLTEGFASAESMFGAQTNEFMVKATTIFATVYFLTCIGLAVLSSQKGKSLMSGTGSPQAQQSEQPPLDKKIDDINIAVGEQESVPEAADVPETIAEPVQVDIPVGTTPSF